MNTSESTLEKTYQVNSLNVNSNRRLSLFGLLGILQDAAWEHAAILGFGYEDIMRKGFFWALIRLKLQMSQWPQWNNELTLKTWTMPVSGFYAIREFELFTKDQKIGACSSTWVILDSDSRKPTMMEKADLLYRPRTDYTVGFSADKLIIPDQMNRLKTFEVENSDLDVNHHANNVKYAQWILDTMSYSTYQKLIVRTYEVNFLSEAFPGNHIEILSDTDKESVHVQPEVVFLGRRIEDNKTVFVARLSY